MQDKALNENINVLEDTMLIAKIYVSKKKIDEIRVQDVTKPDDFHSDIHIYKIRKPEVDKEIYHVRKWGYKPLLIKALNLLDGTKT